MAFNWWAVAETLVKKIPLDKILVPPRDQTKELKEFVETFSAPETEKEAPSNPKTTITTQKPRKASEKPEGVAESGSSGVVTREGLDPGTLAYQEQLAYNELWLAEGHAKDDFLGCGTDVDCGFKHGLNFVAIANETKSMTTDPVWQQIEDLGWELQTKAHPDRVKEQTHHQEYQELAIKISKPRRQIEKILMGKRKPEITLEEAQKIAAEKAVKEIQHRWEQEKK